MGTFSPTIVRKRTKEQRRKNSCPIAPVECSAQETQSVSATSTGAATYHDSTWRAGRKDRARLLASAMAITSMTAGEGCRPGTWKRRRYDAEAMNT